MKIQKFNLGLPTPYKSQSFCTNSWSYRAFPQKVRRGIMAVFPIGMALLPVFSPVICFQNMEPHIQVGFCSGKNAKTKKESENSKIQKPQKTQKPRKNLKIQKFKNRKKTQKPRKVLKIQKFKSRNKRKNQENCRRC